MDGAVWRLAERQYGVVELQQLLALGIGRDAIEHRLERRRLHLIHNGVYAVGTRRLSQRGWWKAATLASGPGAVLSHHDAGALWGFAARRGWRVHVTTPGQQRPRIAGIAGHRTVRLLAEDRAAVDRIPVTAPGRTLLDLAELLDGTGLRRAVEAADRERLFSPREVWAACGRGRGRRGRRPLAAVLREYASDPADVRGELERRFRALCRRARLPLPETNVIVHGELVDAYWSGLRLVVELDSFGFHGTRAAFERDRERDVKLRLAGLTVLRFTWRRLCDDPDQVAAAVREIASSTTSAIRSAGAG